MVKALHVITQAVLPLLLRETPPKPSLTAGLYQKPKRLLCPMPKRQQFACYLFCFQEFLPHFQMHILTTRGSSKQNTPGVNCCLLTALSLSPAQHINWKLEGTHLFSPAPHPHPPTQSITSDLKHFLFSQIPIFFCILLPGQTCAAVLQE